MPFINAKLVKPKAVLVDKRNWATLKPLLIEELKHSSLVGFDIESEDSRRHEGHNRAMKTDDDGVKASNTKLLFDVRRTVVTGFSWYIDGSERAYYLNLAHADVQNRLHFWDDGVNDLLDAKPEGAWWLAHNAPYELTFMKMGHGADMTYPINYAIGKNIICTLQMAVTAFNEDSYPVDAFLGPDLGNIPRLFPQVLQLFTGYEGGELSKEQDEMIYKVTSKESNAEHSYNGYVDTLKYGFGLKRLALSCLGYKQTTFEETLRGKAHMGQLTGDEVVEYGCDDAWVCVDIYHWLLDFILKNSPRVLKTFFEQENPMIHVYADVRMGGVNIDSAQVKRRKLEERVNVAPLLAGFKAAIKTLLPFPEEVHEKLVKYDPKFYGKLVGDELTTAQRYRGQVSAWANTSNLDDPFQELWRTRTSVVKQWCEERGEPMNKVGINLEYYQVVRCILLDLCNLSFQLSDGKIQSDADAVARMRQRHMKKAADAKLIRRIQSKEEAELNEERGTLILDHEEAKWIPLSLGADWVTFKAKLDCVDYLGKLKAVNQAFKLYLSPYENLTDPETGYIYPVLSSMLNSRRMALESPNLSQLAKFKAMAYVRSFFLPDETGPDEEEHIMVSADWSAVELVLIGDQSGDKNFAWAYGQLPHQDLHSITCAALLDEDMETFNAREDKKKQRTDLGKPANFGYWYSGGLGTVAKELGWSSEKMWEYVEKYRSQFPEGEQWRLETIDEARRNGFVTLPDHHVRYRMESTPFWQQMMQQKFYSHGPVIGRFGDMCIKKIARRSGNQAVNSKIQGTGGTLAKRSLLRMINVEIPKHNFDARHLFPVHDELVFSVRRSQAVAFAKVLWEVMTEHPEIVKTLKLDVAVAVGRNYWAWDPKKNPLGQVELDEASKVPCLPKERWGKKLTDEERQTVVDWLFQQKEEVVA
ncbi:putative DNA polymerase [Xylophilus phage Lumi]|nr:putative DNA polymerase [Xylophilus phage Lumi]